jgi:DNA-directed RNA polymerase
MHEQQLERERSMQLQGLQDAKERLQRALDSGAVEQVPGANRLFAALFQQLSSDYAGIQNTRTAGTAAKMRGWFRAVPADTLAVLALNEVLSNMLTGDAVSVQLLLTRLGRRIHLEALVLQAATVSPVYVDQTEEYLAKSGTKSRQHYSTTMRAAVKNVLGEVEFLLDSEYMQLGKLALNSIIEAGVIERQPGTGMHMYALSNPVRNALQAVPEMAAGRSALSMLVQPTPWTSVTQGGYLSSPWHPLLKRGGYRRADYGIVSTKLQHSGMLEIINSIQEQPLSILPGMHSLITELWKDGGGALGVPQRAYPDAPAYPLPDGWKDADCAPEELEDNKLIHEGWLSVMHGWYAGKKKHTSAVLEMHQLVKGLDQPEQPQWFPLFTDSRGRMYYRGRLNPQGSDRAKALLAFHQAKPLGERGLYWLKVALANSFGYDKTRFDARVQWVHDNWECIREGSRRPQDSDFYRSNTEAPCMAVAIAQELVGALESTNPEGYMSRVPVHMDATCSGLQHLSALLRDPDGGIQVNLVDNGQAMKSDLYTAVADRALELAKQDCNGQYAEFADFWLTVGIPRSLAKRPVMTFCYGVTFRGVMRYVDEFLYTEGIRLHGKQVPFKYRRYCTELLLRAIAAAVPKAAEFMQWLQRSVRDRQTETLQWTTAVGFPVVQYIEAVERKRVNVRSCGINQVVIYDRTGQADGMRMRNGIVPNLVHSNDAAHWYMTAQRMRQQGLSCVGIHDSFGTHAADVDSMHTIIRESFVSLYQDYDLVQNYMESNGIEIPAPSTGTLDLELFKQSEFGFC